MLLPQSHFPSNKKKSKSERSVTTMIGVVKSMIGLLVDEAHLCNRLSRPSVKRPKICDFHSTTVLNKQQTLTSHFWPTSIAKKLSKNIPLQVERYWSMSDILKTLNSSIRKKAFSVCYRRADVFLGKIRYFLGKDSNDVTFSWDEIFTLDSHF